MNATISKASVCAVLIAMMAFGAASSPAYAQNAAVQTQVQSGDAWTTLPGRAVDLSINAVGQAYAVDPEGTPWRWDAEQQRWRRMSGSFIRITAAQGNRPWAINADGVVFRYNGLWWEDKDTGVVDVAGDALGNIYIAKNDTSIHKWNPLRSEWRSVEGRGWRIALDATGRLWTVRRNGTIAIYDDERWTTLPGRAQDIAVGGEDGAVIVDAEGRVRRWISDTGRWELVDGIAGVSGVAAAPDGGPWAIVDGGRIMARTLLVAPERIKKEEDQAEVPQASQPQARVEQAPRAVAPTAQAAPVQPVTPAPPAAVADAAQAKTAQAKTARVESAQGEPVTQGPAEVRPVGGTAGSDPATTTFKGDITFVNTRKRVDRLAIGMDGSVFGLQGGNVVRWSNSRQRFESFPGSLVRIAVDADGNPWGVSALGRVFRHDGQAWRQIYGTTASDIAIGADGTVVTANASGRLHRLNDAGTRFDSISGSGTLVGVAPDGTPWTIRSDRLVQRCDTSPCKVFSQKAISLSVGPDGSVWIVSDRNQLMRLNANGTAFDRVQTPGHTPVYVVAGPNGYPWVVSDANVALASTYFDRDETGDRAVAASTSGDTVGSGATASVSSTTVTGFVFTKNMQFTTVNHTSLSGSCPVFASDTDGVMWAKTNGNKLETYSSAKRKFVEESTGFDSWDLESFAIAPDGAIWAKTLNPQTGIFKEDNGTRTEYSVSGATNYNDVAVGVDGTVYVSVSVSGGSRYLYSKSSNATVFTKFSTYNNVRAVEVGPGGDIWIMGDNLQIMRWTGSKFEEPGNVTFNASSFAVGIIEGSLYAIKNGTSDFYKWNSTNNSFDKVNNITIDTFGVDGDGRPWICNDTTPVIKRARD